ncbi:MAG: protein kinase [Myxococcota bacterium]
MLEKRDLQLVRLAVRRRWLTAEQGEDILVLKRQLGAKYTVEDLIAKRGYLGGAEIAELAGSVEGATKRRVFGRPTPPKAETAAPSQTPARRTAPPPTTVRRPPPPAVSRPRIQRPSELPAPAVPRPVAPEEETPAPIERTVVDIRIADVLAARERAARPEVSEPTLYDQRAYAPEPSAAEEQTLIGLPAVKREELLEDNHERTIVGFNLEEILEAQAKQKQQQRARQAPPSTRVIVPEPSSVSVRPKIEPRAPDMVVPQDHSDVDPDLPLVAPVELGSEEVEGELGPYLIERQLGKGSMGTLYLATPKEGGPAIALKVLRPTLARSPEYIERFRREAVAASAIRSPHVVPVISVGTAEGRYYLAMPYIEGFTLREKLDAGEPPGLPEAVRIARDVCDALAAAEAAHVVHRDVKPENIILTGDGKVFLTDFGLARETTSKSELTSAGDRVIGTPHYMAPEQALGMDIDTRADLYALGATFFHVVTGHTLYSGKSSLEIIQKHVREPLPSFGERIAQAPPSLIATLSRLLAKDRAQRFASAQEAADAFEIVLADLSRQGEAARAPAASGVRVASAAFLASAALVLIAVVSAAWAKSQGKVAWGHSGLMIQTAFVGASVALIALIMLGAIGLVRRGELPLPGSTTWLVSVKDLAGVVGAGIIVMSSMLGPPAALSLSMAVLASLALSSWSYGYLLRRSIAARRSDQRMLALFQDPRLRRWRRVHVPMVTALSGLAFVRFALLAYFQAAG